MNTPQSEFRDQLPRDHFLSKLFAEHDVILTILDSIELDSERLQQAEIADAAKPVIDSLIQGANNLLNAEPHHQREEQILFPQMENRGISGPPMVMRAEHGILRDAKHSLVQLLSSGPGLEFQAFCDEVKNSVHHISGFLKAHIQKENTILYPMAFRAIEDDHTWSVMTQLSEEIGECNFTI